MKMLNEDVHGTEQSTFDECSQSTEMVVYCKDGYLWCELDFATFGKQERLAGPVSIWEGHLVFSAL